MSIRPSFQSPLLAKSKTGSESICVPLDFTATAAITVDIAQELAQGKLAMAQSVYIDNADNSVACDLVLTGAPRPIRIRAQANSQGWYPLPWPVGSGQLVAKSNAGAVIDIIIANYPMPYLTWGPASGVLVTPPLTNSALNAVALGAGSNTQLVAGVGGQTIKLYRGIFNVDAPTILKWTSGAGGTVLFTATLTAGGSMTFSVSGVPWFNTAIANDLTLNSSAACNLFGGFGFVQS